VGSWLRPERVQRQQLQDRFHRAISVVTTGRVKTADDDALSPRERGRGTPQTPLFCGGELTAGFRGRSLLKPAPDRQVPPLPVGCRALTLAGAPPYDEDSPPETLAPPTLEQGACLAGRPRLCTVLPYPGAECDPNPRFESAIRFAKCVGPTVGTVAKCLNRGSVRSSERAVWRPCRGRPGPAWPHAMPAPKGRLRQRGLADWRRR
jgi:hypothetical protein